MPEYDGPRRAKYRQAAFVYLHVALLYEATAYAMWRRNMLPTTTMGPGWLWLVLGAAIALAVFGALLRWPSPWLAGSVWFVHGLRLPSLIRNAFFLDTPSMFSPAFYVAAIVLVTLNCWMLARAAWDL